MNKEEYAAAAQALYDEPPGPDLPFQKFKRGFRVKVADEMPEGMKHFTKDFEGIVEYTYAQKYECPDEIDDYSLIQLDEEGNPVNSIAWYLENQLTLVSDDVEAGLKIIEVWRELEKKIEPW
jgi:hypothetical protein